MCQTGGMRWFIALHSRAVIFLPVIIIIIRGWDSFIVPIVYTRRPTVNSSSPETHVKPSCERTSAKKPLVPCYMHNGAALSTIGIMLIQSRWVHEPFLICQPQLHSEDWCELYWLLYWCSKNLHKVSEWFDALCVQCVSPCEAQSLVLTWRCLIVGLKLKPAGKYNMAAILTPKLLDCA